MGADVPGNLVARGKTRAGGKNGDCHQFSPRHGSRNKALRLKRIGWLYPIFHDLHFYHGLLAHAAFQTDSQQLLGLDGELHRQLAENFLAEAVDDHRNSVFVGDATLPAVEELIFTDL